MSPPSSSPPVSLWAHLAKPFAVLLLTFIGGFIDAVGYSSLFGVFPASTTGNLVVAAMAVVLSTPIAPQLCALFTFLGGAYIGGTTMSIMRIEYKAGNRSAARATLFLELFMLVLFWAVGAGTAGSGNQGLSNPDSPVILALVALSSLAMGLQNRCVKWDVLTTRRECHVAFAQCDQELHARLSPNDRCDGNTLGSR